MTSSSGLTSLPDARTGSGYGTLKGHMGQFVQGTLWPYTEPADTDQDDDLDDEVNDPKVRGEEPNIDATNRRNYRSQSYVNGSTRGLTGIMAGAEHEGDILEVGLGAAIGQASPSFNVNGPDGTTRTRPGRKTGSKRGQSMSPPPKEDDVELQAYTLKDIVLNQLAAPLVKADMNKDKARRGTPAHRMRNHTLRAYIRDVLGDSDG